MPAYTTCEYCDLEQKLCKPGCETDDNCAAGDVCVSHNCAAGAGSAAACHVSRVTCPGPGVNGIVNITISTESCSGCIGSGNPTGFVEGGVAVYLQVGQPATSPSSILHLLLVRANTAPSVHLWAWTIWRWWTMTMARKPFLTGPRMMTVTMMVRAICSRYLRTL